MMNKILLFIAIVLPQLAIAQWESFGDDIIPLNHRVWSLKVAPDNSIWATSTLDAFPPVNQVPKTHRSADGGATWTNTGITGAPDAYAWDISPVDSLTAFLAADTAGIFKTEDGGLTWNNLENYPFQAVYIHFFNADEGLVIAADTILGNLVMSTTTDGGETWLNTGNGIGIQPGTSVPDTNDFFPFTYSLSSAYDVHGSTVLHGRSNGNYWRSDDKGLNWTSHTTPLADLNMLTSNIAMIDENTFMVASDVETSFQGVAAINYLTTDAGETWTVQGLSGMTAAATHYIPNSDSVFIMVGHNNFGWGEEGTSISYDRGATWEKIDDTSLIIVDFNENGVGAGSCCNNIWETANGQIHGWDFDLPVGTVELSNKQTQLTISPNPFVDNLAFETNSFENLDITITDISGRIWQQFQSNGQSEFSKDLTDLPKGMYLVQIFDGVQTVTERLVKQ